MKRVGQSILIIFLALTIAPAASIAWAGKGEGEAGQFFKVYPVGTVEKKAGITSLKIADKYAKALKGLEGFSHVVVLYWLDKTPIKHI